MTLLKFRRKCLVFLAGLIMTAALALALWGTTDGQQSSKSAIKPTAARVESSVTRRAEDGVPMSLASTTLPLENPKPGFSLLKDRGVVAGTCADTGYEYIFSFAEDLRTEEWDKVAVKSHRNKGVSNSLCGYGFHNEHAAAGMAGHIMIDIGANMGLSLFPYFAKGWKIIAFEPVLDNINTIRRNIFINGVREDQIALVHAAVSDTNGNITIYAPKGRTDNTAISKVSSTTNVGGKADAYEVPAVTIDSYLHGALEPRIRKMIALVKIDTQGHELNVLQGMEKFLSDPPTKEDLGGVTFSVIAEYAPNLQIASGHDPDEMLQFMRGLGYVVRCEYGGDPIIHPNRPICADVIFTRD